LNQTADSQITARSGRWAQNTAYDETELEGLLPTIGYVPIRTGIEKIGEMLIKKLG